MYDTLLDLFKYQKKNCHHTVAFTTLIFSPILNTSLHSKLYPFLSSKFKYWIKPKYLREKNAAIKSPNFFQQRSGNISDFTVISPEIFFADFRGFNSATTSKKIN